MGDVPAHAIKGGDQTRFHGLLLFAVVGRIGLAGDEEDLADPDVCDRSLDHGLSFLGESGFQTVPAAGLRDPFHFERLRQPDFTAVPFPFALAVDQANFELRAGSVTMRAGDGDAAFGAVLTLEDLVVGR